ncbi:thioesterase family protein [Flavobacterium agricola]|uniref:Thioesterase family protein n=1 Tax=Flavobacterium agricola TaxID=2870839 RepID=A0ABY6LZ83_9FLAO|nr:acyl-CoA thioesterase [Flavobacterium agricola]UYW01501.1 thioesterase family protein [Flavobacterium agricola]
METIFYKGQVLWSMIDANRHVRHSAYSDMCTQARSNLMIHIGLSMKECLKLGIGPVLFREETLFKREVRMDEFVYIEVALTKYDTQKSRFSIEHKLFKVDGTLSAIVNVDGAFMNLKERALTVLPQDIQAKVLQIPKATTYVEI